MIFQKFQSSSLIYINLTVPVFAALLETICLQKLANAVKR